MSTNNSNYANFPSAKEARSSISGNKRPMHMKDVLRRIQQAQLEKDYKVVLYNSYIDAETKKFLMQKGYEIGVERKGKICSTVIYW